jgi:ribosomal protein S18 acetylase RimI-like enzyme
VFNYKSLETVNLKILHKAFLKGFLDYQVKLELPILKFKKMIQRNAYNEKASIGAFENDELIGFILNGIRNWNGRLTAYDSGTAVIQEYRKQGITSNMFLNTKQILKEMEVEQYLLEVIQTNSSAVELYKKQGFKILRELECFYLEKDEFRYRTNYKVQQVDRFSEEEWTRFQGFWDFTPSWQNAIGSINVLEDTFIYSIVSIEDIIIGYGIIERESGDIPQIAVDKKYRCKGIGRSIMSDLIQNTEANRISVLNVDFNCNSLKNFLTESGFEIKVSQYEMNLEI